MDRQQEYINWGKLVEKYSKQVNEATTHCGKDRFFKLLTQAEKAMIVTGAQCRYPEYRVQADIRLLTSKMTSVCFMK
jgi:hypothetical protein